ncbi:hypothetical protein BCV71DRAFT_84270 [Rhizopus microsporus]|uniref:Uncharacterized protein n=1 Tax=Rhizopus microsporus TaxID=58291 RepID=A0A1X0S820_RHIZD|nr:hypothetical protein BCV71DRAFT_84270 [Rhizopus microsporus]
MINNDRTYSYTTSTASLLFPLSLPEDALLTCPTATDTRPVFHNGMFSLKHCYKDNTCKNFFASRKFQSFKQKKRQVHLLAYLSNVANVLDRNGMKRSWIIICISLHFIYHSLLKELWSKLKSDIKRHELKADDIDRMISSIKKCKGIFCSSFK